MIVIEESISTKSFIISMVFTVLEFVIPKKIKYSLVNPKTKKIVAREKINGFNEAVDLISQRAKEWRDDENT